MSARPTSPKALEGSPEARRKLALFLEALAGARTIQDVSEELGVAVVRYYVLEARMLQAMVDALEPQRRGPKKSAGAEMEQLREKCQELERELSRLKALYRTTQRAVGVSGKAKRPAKGAAKGPSKGPAKGAATKKGETGRAKRSRGPRKISRAERIAQTVRPPPDTFGDVAGSAAANPEPTGPQPAGPYPKGPQPVSSEPAPNANKDADHVERKTE